MSDEEIVEVNPEMLEDDELFLDDEDAELGLKSEFGDDEESDSKPSPEEE